MARSHRAEAQGSLLTRRQLLRGAAASVLAAALGGEARAASEEPRRLRMLHTHTLERVDVVYHDGSRLQPDALAELDRFLRDHYTGDVHPIDPGVIDLAWSVARAAGRPSGELQIVCGYRTPRTNAMLRGRSERTGVATRSLHLEGRAIDLRLPGVATRHLRDLAWELGRGGVGFYAAADFIHVDTGRLRRW